MYLHTPTQSSVITYNVFSDILREYDDFKYIKLDEMPQLIPNLNKVDDLDIYTVNRSKFKMLRGVEKLIYHTFDKTHILYNTNNQYFCLDYDKNKVTYYMEFKVNTDRMLGTYLWQTLVWRSKVDPYTIDLPHEIFFTELLPKYGTVCTDGQQTADGRRFWNYQITYALKHNINVYYYNMQSKELVKIDDMLHFTNVIAQYDVWGETPNHKNKLMIITNHIMPRS